MGAQLILAYARKTDPATSHQAAQSVSNAEKLRAQILRILAGVGSMTDEEIYSMLPMPKPSPSGARTRRAELVDKGLVWDTGLRRTTKAGRNTVVWGYAR